MMIPQMVTQRFVRDCAVRLLYLMVPSVIFFCNKPYPLCEATPTKIIEVQYLISQKLVKSLQRTGSVFYFIYMQKNLGVHRMYTFRV